MVLSSRWDHVSENFMFGKINDLGEVRVEKGRDFCHVCHQL